MKSRIFTWIAAVTLFTALAMPVRPQAQEQSAQEQPATQEQKAEPARYIVKDLGTLGGTSSIAFGINNAGRVGGGASLEPNGPLHAFLWYGGHMTDLSTLGGPNSEAA